MRSFKKLIDAGRLAHSNGKLHEAIEYFEYGLAAVNDENDTVDTLEWIGICHFELGDYAAARNAFESQLKIDPGAEDAIHWWSHSVLKQAIVAFKEENYQRGADLFKLVLKRPGIPDSSYRGALMWLGISLLALGDYGNAIESFEIMLRAVPDNRAAMEFLAYLLATVSDDSLRDAGRALTIAEELLAREDTYWGHLTLKAAALAEFGEFNEAIQLYTLAMDKMPVECQELRKENLELLRNRRPIRSNVDYDRKNLQLWQQRVDVDSKN